MSEQILPKKDRSWLVYRESIKTEMRQGAAAKAISEYFEAIGYRQTEISPSMQFERGSLLASWYNPNPRSQKTVIVVDILGGGGQIVIELVMRINRAGNVPLSKDFEFWQAEVDGLANTLHYGYCDPRISEFAADRAKWYSIAIMLGMVFVATVVTFVLAIGAAALAGNF